MVVGCIGSRAIASDEEAMGSEILHRQVKRIKLIRARVIGGKLANE